MDLRLRVREQMAARHVSLRIRIQRICNFGIAPFSFRAFPECSLVRSVRVDRHVTAMLARC